MVSEVINARKQEVPLQDDNSNVFLQVMVCIAVFLFGVTLSGVLSINAMLSAWNDSILGALTVQIMPIMEGNKDAVFHFVRIFLSILYGNHRTGAHT